MQNTVRVQFCLRLYINTECWKYLTEKHLTLPYHLKEDLHVYSNICDKLHDKDKDAQIHFYWCSPRHYWHSYIILNKRKNIVALDICLIHLLICRKWQCFYKFYSLFIDVLFPGHIFIDEYAQKFCNIFPFDINIFNKKVKQGLLK